MTLSSKAETKSLYVNNTSFYESDNSCGHVQQCHLSFGEFLISYQELPELVKWAFFQKATSSKTVEFCRGVNPIVVPFLR